MISLNRYLREAWSATPALTPVGVARSGYQKVIDRNLRSGNNTITLLKNKRRKMISISELVYPQSSVKALPDGRARVQVRTPIPGNKVNMKPSHLRTPGAIPSAPNLNQMMGTKLNQMRKNVNVSPYTGTKFPSTAYSLMGKDRKVPAGMAFANVPKVPIRR